MTLFAGVAGEQPDNIFVKSTWSGAYRLPEGLSGADTSRPILSAEVALGVYLPAAAYWLDWQAAGDPGLDGPYAPPLDIPGQTDTGNARIFSGAWGPALDLAALTQQGFPFSLIGYGGDGGCRPGEASWVRPDRLFGALPLNVGDHIQITLDAAALLPGTHSAGLCIVSHGSSETAFILYNLPVEINVDGFNIFIPVVVR